MHSIQRTHLEEGRHLRDVIPIQNLMGVMEQNFHVSSIISASKTYFYYQPRYRVESTAVKQRRAWIVPQ